MTKIWTPLPLANIQNFTSLTTPTPHPPPSSTTITQYPNPVILYIHEHQLQSATINATKNILLIWMFPVFS